MGTTVGTTVGTGKYRLQLVGVANRYGLSNGSVHLETVGTPLHVRHQGSQPAACSDILQVKLCIADHLECVKK